MKFEHQVFAQQYMNIWAIQRDAAMDGRDVSRLVATAFLEYPIQNSLHRMYESIHLWQLLKHLWANIKAKEPVGKDTYRDREIVAPHGKCYPWIQNRWWYRAAHSGCNPSVGKTVKINNKSHVSNNNKIFPIPSVQFSLDRRPCRSGNIGANSLSTSRLL
jgi:hypothetical protein